MGLLGKIGDKIGEKIDDKLNSKNESDNWRTRTEYKEVQSAENCKKYEKEISNLQQEMEKIELSEFYDEQAQDLLDCCLKITEFDTWNFDANMAMVRALITLEKFEEAIQFCSPLLEDYPNDPVIENQMGDILLYSKNPEDSIPYYDSVIQKTPYTDFEALSAKQGKAIALQSMGEFEEVIQFCEDQLSLHENDKVLLDIKEKSKEYLEKENEDSARVENQMKQADELLEQTDSTSNEKSQNTSDSFIADELSKLAKLKEQGAITEDEFLQMKQKLMDKM